VISNEAHSKNAMKALVYGCCIQKPFSNGSRGRKIQHFGVLEFVSKPPPEALIPTYLDKANGDEAGAGKTVML
jgi:hypothetical protein